MDTPDATPPLPSTGKIVAALSKARPRFEDVKKNRENSHLKSRYANLAAVISATAPALAENGVVVVQSPEPQGAGWCLVTTLRHESGEFLTSALPLVVSPADAQKFGSALTYMRRYALQSMLNISAEEDDDDGHQASQGTRGNRAPVDVPPAEPPEAPVWVIMKRGVAQNAKTPDAYVNGWDAAHRRRGNEPGRLPGLLRSQQGQP